jgi:hypothetical protein
MPSCPSSLCLALAVALGVLLATPARAQGDGTGVYRCGNSYSAQPCPGGKAVAADDTRTADQRLQALAVRQQQARLADELAAERRAREQAAVGQQAARIGPSAAERAAADAAQAKARAKAAAERQRSEKKAGRKPKQRDRLGAA